MLILFIALGVFLGILGWKVIEAGVKTFPYLVAVAVVIWLVGFLLQNPLLFVLCIMVVIYLTLAIRGTPSRRAVENQGIGHVPTNIATKAIGKTPTIAFSGYYSPWYNPFDLKYFVVAKESNIMWIINYDPFSYEIVETYPISINDVFVEVKKGLLGGKVIIKTPEKIIKLNTNFQDRQEAEKLSDAILWPEPSVYSEEELQKTIYDKSPEDLVMKLKQWQKEPNSQPEIEYYYQNYALRGETLPRPPQKWEKEAEDYIPQLDVARSLEKTGNTEEALKIYLDIIERYNPIGTDYYERPAIILEKLGRIEQAISVCEKALATPHLEKSRDLFEKRLERLKKKGSRK